jgi:hypothetical protein
VSGSEGENTPPEFAQSDLPLVDAQLVEQGGEVSNDVTVPKDGYLTHVYLDFPSGANQSLGIGVRGADDESLVPYGPKGFKYVALNDTTIDFTPNYRVEKGDNLTVEYVNNRPVDEPGYLTTILVVTEV